MTRQSRSAISLALCVLTLISGCAPTQPYFFAEDGNILGKGDLSHYLDVATEIEYPDVDSVPLDEVSGALAPLSISNSENFDIVDMTLEEVTRITLTNSKVMRQLGGRITDGGSNIAVATPEILTQNPGAVPTVYDPALVESGNGTGTGSPFSGTGVEAALAEFDATLDASATFNKNNRPQNFGGLADTLFAQDLHQDLNTYTAGISKTAANGSTFGFRHNTFYDFNNNGSRITRGDWFTNFEASFNQPLLQGAGTQYNRIAGPISFQQYANGGANQIDGVIISRIRTDIALTDFEQAVQENMFEVEEIYWELYFAYRDLDARKIGRDSSLETWRKVQALKGVGTQGGEADKEAQARSQYFLFRSQVEAALTNLFRIESRLRYKMGLAATDSRLIRPCDEPTTAQVAFDWPSVHLESLTRRTEIRNQKWQIKRREMELIATKNNLMPRLDASGTYRWLGAGEDLMGSSNTAPFGPGSNAFSVLENGNYQEWQLGVQFTMPLGFRSALAGVRHHQLLLARERAVLEDLELNISHQISETIRDVDFNFVNTQSLFNRRVASQDEVDSIRTVYEAGRVPIDLLLDAQRRRAEAESAYYRSLVDYNRSIMRVHYRKGSLLEYNGVYLAEGPWPAKAYFDALRRARQRDASTFIDYGYSRPNVISRGPVGQFMDMPASSGQPEAVPTPMPTPQGVPAPQGAQSPEDNSLEMPLPEPQATDGGSYNPNGASLNTNFQDINFANLPIAEDNFSYGFAGVPTAVETALPVNTAPVSQIGFVTDAVPTAQNQVITAPAPSNSPAVNATPENPFRNPNRQESTQWVDSTTQGLPATTNPNNESHENHTTAEATANAPGGERP